MSSLAGRGAVSQDQGVRGGHDSDGADGEVADVELARLFGSGGLRGPGARRLIHWGRSSRARSRRGRWAVEVEDTRSRTWSSSACGVRERSREASEVRGLVHGRNVVGVRFSCSLAWPGLERDRCGVISVSGRRRARIFRLRYEALRGSMMMAGGSIGGQ